MGDISILQTIISLLIGSLSGAWTSYFIYRIKFKENYKAEKIIKIYLGNKIRTKRSFYEIKRRLKWFEDDELRKLLIRSWAICFEKEDEQDKEKKELWWLVEKNKNDIN